ncbi:MAG: BREX-3 system phosphatase PglZ [Rubrobacteraceae bacterium]
MSWREEILRDFPTDGHKLTLAADPDYLLPEEAVAAELRKRGYETLEYGDPIAFRYAYEADYKARWKAGEEVSLVVVVRGGAWDLERLPYDLIVAGKKLSFGLIELFPNLSHPVVDALDRTNLDKLREAYRAHPPDRLLGQRATADFVLRHVYGVAPETIISTASLLRLLLSRHYEAWELPEEVDERLLHHLKSGGRFEEWPLEEILPDRDAFLTFLQERWPIFVYRAEEKEGLEVKEPSAVYETSYSGPRELPFDGAQMRVYIDNMFLEGMLRPTSHPKAEHLADEWLAVDLKTEPEEDNKRRLDGLLKNIRDAVPEPHSNRHEWLSFARKWAELEALRHETEVSRLDDLPKLRERVDASFLEWVMDKYGGLHNLSATSPAMVHHIPRFLARRLEEGAAKRVALVVVDGLALGQWVVLREALAGQIGGVRLYEDAVFAWAPTITPVCRQSIFAANPPAYFPASIHTTDREQTLWRRFWSDSAKLSSKEVAYANVAGDGDAEDIGEAVSGHRVKVAGIVVRKVDDIMHGMELGARGMHSQVRLWAEEGYVKRLIEFLLRGGFEVCLTSDHGNVEARGIGRPSEGAIAGVRGERARVYADGALRERVAERFPGAIEWSGSGLPPDYLPLLAPDRAAFISENRRIVGHGGVSIEELVVPFARIKGEKD